MSTVGQIKKSFSFLKDYKFKRKIYSEITDYEIVYFKGDLKISIYYSLCVSDKLIKEYGNEYKNLLKESYFGVGIIVQKGKIRRNILDCTLFSSEKLFELNNIINEIPNSNTLELINTYSKFLQQNIDCLLKK